MPLITIMVEVSILLKIYKNKVLVSKHLFIVTVERRIYEPTGTKGGSDNRFSSDSKVMIIPIL